MNLSIEILYLKKRRRCGKGRGIAYLSGFYRPSLTCNTFYYDFFFKKKRAVLLTRSNAPSLLPPILSLFKGRKKELKNMITINLIYFFLSQTKQSEKRFKLMKSIWMLLSCTQLLLVSN